MNFKSTVTAFAAVVMFSLPAPLAADVGSDRAKELLDELGRVEQPAIAERLERELRNEWSKSGSASMDLLLKRGRDALEVEDVDAALEHLRALTDHAPGFAEGWHMLALALYQAERFGPAMDALERTLALNPQHFGALRGVGAIWEQLERPELAYDAYARAAALRPLDEDVTEALDRLEGQALGTAL